MLYQVTISTPDLDVFASLAVLLRNAGLEGEVKKASEIIEHAVATKRAKKHVAETVAAIAPTEQVAFDEEAYKAAGVADATKELNRAVGRDAVIALLAEFFQTGDAPSARNIAPANWQAYVTKAKHLAKVAASKNSAAESLV